MNGRRTPSIRWKPPLKPCMMHVWCGSGREVTLSLTGKKKRIAHRVSVDQPSLCAVVQSAAARWRMVHALVSLCRYAGLRLEIVSPVAVPALDSMVI